MSRAKHQARTHLPVRLDAAKMVAERRVFEGSLAVDSMARLRQDLADDRGRVEYTMAFARDELGGGQLHLRLSAGLVLECQRTLQDFVFPLELDTRLGLIDNEHQQAGLPPGVEPLMLDDGFLRPVAVIEDELLLALPLVPVKPGASLPESATEFDADESARDNPFAVLGKLKQKP